MRGTLQEVSLLDVIRLLTLQPGFQGKVEVVLDAGKRQTGVVYISDGQVVGAFAPGESGINALPTLLRSRGTFESEVMQLTPAHRNIQNLYVDQLVQFSLQRSNLWDVIRQRVPTLDLVPRFNYSIARPVNVALHPKHWQVIFRIDGNRTLREIGELTGLDDLAVSQVICELQDLGVIEGSLYQPQEVTLHQLRRIVVRACPDEKHRGSAPLGNAALVMRTLRGTMNLAELQERTSLEHLSLLSAVRQLLVENRVEIVEGAEWLRQLK